MTSRFNGVEVRRSGNTAVENKREITSRQDLDGHHETCKIHGYRLGSREIEFMFICSSVNPIDF